jgi:RNA polymerase sigma factor (sigma-70 family)
LRSVRSKAPDDLQRTIVAAWRIEQPRLITSLARMVRNIPLAEDLTSETLLAALEAWPASGVPENPGAWLMAPAKRRAIDAVRREKMLDRKHATLAQDLEAEQQVAPDLDAVLNDDFGDEQLRLIFTACHPLLSAEARAALTLKMMCGLTTHEIARAFIVPEATIAQRIVRAKRALANSGLTYETPRGEAIAARMSSVLEVIYVIFNEGYAAASGDDWMRPQLCEEALRLGRILTSIAPEEPEAHGLTSLMELNASRIAARTDAAGEPILLLEQNRALWDRVQIRRGVQALERARSRRRGRFLCIAGSDRCVSCAGTDGRRHRLVSDRYAVWTARRGIAFARHRAQSRDCRCDGGRPASRARDHRCNKGRSYRRPLSPRAERARRLAQ